MIPPREQNLDTFVLSNCPHLVPVTSACLLAQKGMVFSLWVSDILLCT